MPTSSSRSAIAIVLAAGAMVAGCGVSQTRAEPPEHARPRTTVPTTPPASPPTRPDCPPIASGAPIADVDYVDFVQFRGTEYVADLGHAVVSPARLGAEQFRVRCSFSRLNAQTQRLTPRAGDGDAAFLPPGTAVYSIDGWSPLCRLAAKHGGRWHVYLATKEKAIQTTPKACAQGETHPSSPGPTTS